MDEKYVKLDEIAAPDAYVISPSREDLDYIIRFRQVCKRYNIDFAAADEDEREFVIRMAEKSTFAKRAFSDLIRQPLADSFPVNGEA